jgi:predicted acylesterase/phospholipase RssA
LVGTSVGAINATAMAIKPSLEGAQQLADIWRKVTRKTVMPNGYPSMVWRFVTGQRGLFTNEKLRKL